MTFRDKNFGESVAAIEHKYYPIYALQFHPEKLLYDPEFTHIDEESKEIAKIFQKMIKSSFLLPKRSKKSEKIQEFHNIKIERF